MLRQDYLEDESLEDYLSREGLSPGTIPPWVETYIALFGPPEYVEEIDEYKVPELINF